MEQQREYYRRHLPHWQPQGATFFVTFRLKGSLPKAVIASLRDVTGTEERALERLPENQRKPKDYLDERKSFGRWDSYLDHAEFGPHWLSQPEIAEVVKQALNYRDGQTYTLFAYCIMSNHVHVIFKPVDKEGSPTSSLNKIMQSLKRHTARKANILLGR